MLWESNVDVSFTRVKLAEKKIYTRANKPAVGYGADKWVNRGDIDNDASVYTSVKAMSQSQWRNVHDIQHPKLVINVRVSIDIVKSDFFFWVVICLYTGCPSYIKIIGKVRSSVEFRVEKSLEIFWSEDFLLCYLLVKLDQSDVRSCIGGRSHHSCARPRHTNGWTLGINNSLGIYRIKKLPNTFHYRIEPLIQFHIVHCD